MVRFVRLFVLESINRILRNSGLQSFGWNNISYLVRVFEESWEEFYPS
uniref:Uncharacterized protein n=1 Tax=Moniliophthora roreri TaxID=221103 RepID=A0A0W0G179_MONRR